MKKLLAVLFMSLSFPALAGSITIQVVEGGQPNATKAFAIPDADIDRIVAANQSAANIAVNGTATRAQVINYWVTQFMSGTVMAVQAYELDKAQKAITSPVPINPQ